jgi:hypothetical protein
VATNMSAVLWMTFSWGDINWQYTCYRSVELHLIYGAGHAENVCCTPNGEDTTATNAQMDACAGLTSEGSNRSATADRTAALPSALTLLRSRK